MPPASRIGLYYWSRFLPVSGEGHEHIIELDPIVLTRYIDLGNFYGISGQCDKALATARQIESRFNDAAAYPVIARIHERAGDLDEGIARALRVRAYYKDRESVGENV